MKYELNETTVFKRWLGKVDRRIRIQVLGRLARVENGNLGDHRSVGGRVFELRIHSGTGVRVYYTLQDQRIIILLAGGDKSDQDKVIRKARKLAAALRG